MKIQLRIDNFKVYDMIIIPLVVVGAIFIGTILQLFGPTSYTTKTECAYKCNDNSMNEYDVNNCQGIDPNSGETFYFNFERLDSMNRYTKLYFIPYLHKNYIDDHPSFLYLEINTNLTLSYKEKGTWNYWEGGEFNTSLKCYNGGNGECGIVQWINEPYVMQKEQRIEVTIQGPKNVISNICLMQVYGSKSYSIMRIVYNIILTIICSGYIIYYFIYLIIKRIYPRDLDKQQYLNIGLMIFGLVYNDPLDLLSLAISSAFFPIFHGIMNILFLGYLVFFVTAFFQSIRIEEGILLNKKVEWIVIILSTLTMMFSFSFSASVYLKGMTDNPFSVTKPTTTVAVLFYVISVISATVIFVWISFIFLTSYKTIKRQENIRKGIYFCLGSFLVIGLEFFMLLMSDYSSFFSTTFTSEIIIFGINAYFFVMFYGFVPTFANTFDEVIIGPDNQDDTTRPILFDMK
ncbi:hypothetical protein EHI8A_103830 [Entamoeba histolytica HM-1:IMSS-B]|uniref:Wntless-like transmembrane domain-containing protein n=8 Tax=Entamoeba histolytica TaxID=5759 RepID=C4M6Z0_ENTH1|nr:hypothetical protein EHI_056400 [Entamoeba histolytica HM-1:IMSS]EMD43624.1 Hypothetical protein EHI5A_016040 [Entamoeba histolytica KU27]EMH73650.1 hypothetical protein EHI8A_103830 [Entamoeba histolytica HM-1:IMSS-B]EMS16437.1 hypothetical protein KM1_173700 [Entamoeba histolytica HM-3:IMSS]ENY60727.1 hypothetical protein EHI7A_103360 [Entamoeba histolytica HM-1:IMSS-A]GAT97271.1 hypothetical protein CL6EHI_056400 [Entamoeba histolytica]|eukprot:XP_650732.1 hypothetical protein EHI_056400 [Entamoeba histolytica HM-1:IMSS]